MGGPAVEEGCSAQGSSHRRWVPTQDVTQAATDAPRPTSQRKMSHTVQACLCPPCFVVALGRRMRGGGPAKQTQTLSGAHALPWVAVIAKSPGTAAHGTEGSRAPPCLPRSCTCSVCEATTSTHKVWLDFNDERWLCTQY